MKPFSPVSGVLLRIIASVYLLLFICALISSAYLLNYTIALKPILLIRLLQYVILCVLFSILILNSLRALTLRPKDINRLLTSTKNFKWLFSLASVICIAAWAGLFNQTDGAKRIEVTLLQVIILVLLAIFCFWSNSYLETPYADEEKKLEV